MFPYTETEKAILDHFSVKIAFFRLILLEFPGFAVSVAVLPLYAKRWPFLSIFKWYSDWGVFLAIFTFALCIVASSMLLHVYFEPHVSHKFQRWANWVFLLRDIFLNALFQQLIQTCISFWISYSQDPSYELGLESYISHGYLLFHLFITYLFTTVYFSKWSLIISIYYTSIYYFFVVARWIITENWVYPGLDPSWNPYWFLIVFSTPFGQVIVFWAWSLFNYLKNKLYVKLQQIMEFSIMNLPYIFARDTRHFIQSEIFVSSMLILVFSLYVYIVTLVIAIYKGSWAWIGNIAITLVTLSSEGYVFSSFLLLKNEIDLPEKLVLTTKLKPWTLMPLLQFSIFGLLAIMVVAFVSMCNAVDSVYSWYAFEIAALATLSFILHIIANEFVYVYKLGRPKHFSHQWPIFSHYFE